MPINTVTTAIVPASQVKAVSGFDAQGATGTTQAIAYWFNSASPANSLVFAAVSGVVNVWRTDLRTTTALTGATRLGEFRQGSDSAITDLKFTTSGATGYLLIAGNTTNIWCYAIDLTTIASISSLGGEAIVLVNNTSGNLGLNSQILDFNFGGSGLYVPTTISINQQFRTSLDNTIYKINSVQTISSGTGIISQSTGAFSGPLVGMGYAPPSASRQNEFIYVCNATNSTISIIDPVTNQLFGVIGNTGAANVTFPLGSNVLSVPRGIAYAPAVGNRPEALYITNPGFSNVVIVNASTNQLIGTIPQATGSFSGPRAIAYLPATANRTERLYVTNANNNSVSVVQVNSSSTPVSYTLFGVIGNTVGSGITIGLGTGVLNNPYGVAYAPQAGQRSERVYFISLSGTSGITILNPVDNSYAGTVSTSTFQGSGPSGIAYASAAGQRPEQLYVFNNSNNTISILNPTNSNTSATFVNLITNSTASTYQLGPGAINGPEGGTCLPALGGRGERLYTSNSTNSTVLVINSANNTNTLVTGTALRVGFDRVNTSGGNGLSTAVSVGTPIIFVGPFYTPRLRFLASTSPKLAIDSVNNFLLIQNTANIFLYRNINLSSFDGTSNVTVSGTSIPPFTSTIGYYDISTPSAVLTAATTNIAFYYKATNAYILATLGTHQWIIYRLNADTLSSTIASPTTPTIAAVFSTNTLSASSLVRDVAFAVVGSNLVVLAAGTSVNLLYRFATNAYDSTSNTAVAASAALIQFPHGQATTAGRLVAIYHNASTGRTVFYSANAAGTSIYDLNLTSFTGTAAVTLKALSVAPSANQYTLQDYHANARISSFATLENSNYDPATIGNSTLAGLAGTFALSTLNRANTELVLLTQRFLPGPPALTKASASAPITLATEVDSYQALNILSTASQFLSLGTDTYSSGEYYPWNYLVTDDTAGTLSDSFTFSSATAGITGNYRISMASGTTTTLSSKGTYNDSFTLLSGATLALTANTTLTTEFILSSGVSVVRAAGAPASVTLTIPYADPGLSLGSGVSLSAPQPLTITNLISNSRVRVTRVDTGAELTKTLVTGTSVSFAITYQGAIRVEARNASGATAYKPWVAVATLAGTPVTLTASQEVD